MKKSAYTIIFLLPFLIGSLAFRSVAPGDNPGINAKTGFLILAPDRGFLGNEEINDIFEKFKKEYPASLALIGRSETEQVVGYEGYLEKAVADLKAQQVTQTVVIPLFLSATHAMFKTLKVDLKKRLGTAFHWGPSMSKSYLMSQILLDWANALSEDPEAERLVIMGMGAYDKESEKAIKKELEQQAQYISRYKDFKEIQIGAYYSRTAEKTLREKKNKELEQMIITSAARKGKTILLPFHLGPKFSHRMSLNHWLARKYKEFDLVFSRQEVLSHPNVLIWMKKTANQFIEIRDDQVGVVAMPHGAYQPYNDAVEEFVAPLRKKYRLEMAYGMGDSETIADAVWKLEQQGIRKIIFARIYSLSGQFKERTDYILGLVNSMEKGWDGLIPSQVRSGAVFSAFGGYEEDPLIREILLSRIQEISSQPDQETVILLAHGAKSDAKNQQWIKVMESNIEWIKKQLKDPFKKIMAMTLREDWPEKKKKALTEIRKAIEDGSKNGRVLVISNRLHGSGPYEHALKGMNFTMNKKGFAPNKNMTLWLEKGIESELQRGMASSAPNEIASLGSNVGQSPLAVATVGH